MVNNFKLIKSLLSFESEDIYYHLQILRRGKDHPELPAANRMIKSYFICKAESLDYLEDEIINLCKMFGARAYINLAPKSTKKTALLQLKYLAQRVYEGDYQKIWKSWDSCAGEVKGEKPRWIVDIDDKSDISHIDDIKEYINSLEPRNIVYPEGDITPSKVITEINTKTGYHIITNPFNIQRFREKYPNIDIHKNNPTLLYCL